MLFWFGVFGFRGFFPQGKVIFSEGRQGPTDRLAVSTQGTLPGF